MSSDERRVDGRALRHRHRRPELLDAAVEYVLEHGIADLSLRPFARELGVTHATLLRHFGTKEELVREVVVRVREDLLDESARLPPDRAPATPAEAMRGAWRRLTDPAQRRQFVLLFELVAAHARDPERFGPLAPLLVTDFLGPVRQSLERYGVRDADAVATGFLALVRGLQLDLAVTGDEQRAEAALEHYVRSVTVARD